MISELLVSPQQKGYRCTGLTGSFFDERAMFNYGNYKVDQNPVCSFEASAHKIKVPEKTLRAVNDRVRLSQMYLSIEQYLG